MFELRKIIIMSLLFLPLSMGYAQTDSSDEENPITDPVLLEKLRQIDTMEKLLEITRSDSITTGALNDEREEKFIDARDRQKALLDEAKARLTLEEERAVRLQKQFEENEKILEEISETLRIRIGNFGELFGVVRQVSGEAIATLKNSLVSIQYPGRGEGLAELAETRNLPSIDQMKNLLVILLEEMTKSGNVERFDSEVILPGGSISDAEIVRVGVFNAITEDYFLKFIPA